MPRLFRYVLVLLAACGVAAAQHDPHAPKKPDAPNEHPASRPAGEHDGDRHEAKKAAESRASEHDKKSAHEQHASKSGKKEFGDDEKAPEGKDPVAFENEKHDKKLKQLAELEARAKEHGDKGGKGAAGKIEKMRAQEEERHKAALERIASGKGDEAGKPDKGDGKGQGNGPKKP